MLTTDGSLTHCGFLFSVCIFSHELKIKNYRLEGEGENSFSTPFGGAESHVVSDSLWPLRFFVYGAIVIVLIGI